MLIVARRGVSRVFSIVGIVGPLAPTVCAPRGFFEPSDFKLSTSAVPSVGFILASTVACTDGSRLPFHTRKDGGGGSSLNKEADSEAVLGSSVD